jgi:hypothetical protein
MTVGCMYMVAVQALADSVRQRSDPTLLAQLL